MPCRARIWWIRAVPNISVPTQKRGWDGPKWGREVLFPANPDLADILGDTDFDFENSYFLDVLGSQNFQISRSQISRNLAWAKLGPGLGPWLEPGPFGPGLGPGLGPETVRNG